jgi:hypothetical protein
MLDVTPCSSDINTATNATLVNDYDNLWDGTLSTDYWTDTNSVPYGSISLTEARGGISMAWSGSVDGSRTLITDYDLRQFMKNKKIEIFCSMYAEAVSTSNNDSDGSIYLEVTDNAGHNSTLASVVAVSPTTTDSRGYCTVLAIFSLTLTSDTNLNVKRIGTTTASTYDAGAGAPSATATLATDNSNINLSLYTSIKLKVSCSANFSIGLGGASKGSIVISCPMFVDKFLGSKGTGGTVA